MGFKASFTKIRFCLEIGILVKSFISNFPTSSCFAIKVRTRFDVTFVVRKY
jgi:hypothetical protein